MEPFVRTARSAVDRRGLLILLATFAIIAGLLGMHTLTAFTEAAATTGGAMHPASPAPSSHAAAEEITGADPAVTPSAEHCGGDCPRSTPDHRMMSMLCVLALLSVAIVLLLPSAQAWSRTSGSALMRIPAVLLRTLPLARPPSLHVLSISRT